MGLFSLFLCVVFSHFALGGDRTAVWEKRWGDISQLLKLLEAVPEGKELIEKAVRKDPEFASKIKIGRASFTETTFNRTYSLANGRERVSLEHDLTLNRALSLADAVVDLAHELVHYNEKGMLDPYKSGFEVSRFIRSGIEGEGGELAALEMECKIAWSFEEKFEGFPEHRLCVRYKRAGHRFAKEVARLDYYAVGAWMENLPPSLREKIPEISERASVFMSSYANKPYPVALAEEYWATRQLACKNNRKKFQLIAAQSATGRSIASLELKEEQRRLQDYEERYCMPTKVEVFDN